MSREELAIEEILYALNECFDGEGRSGGIFLEPEDPGLLSILAALNAEEASAPVAGTSIATHVYHLIYALCVFIKRINADKADPNATPVDWSESWQEYPLNEAEWESMKKDLSNFREDATTLARYYNAGEPGYYEKHLRLVMGLLTHTVFHLGIIRVISDERLKGEANVR